MEFHSAPEPKAESPDLAAPEPPFMDPSTSPTAPLATLPGHRHLDGAFQGSFAGTARDITVVYVRPWYRRRDYYLDGWRDAVIWRAAVGVKLCLLSSMPPLTSPS
jgi:hypothetical protein